MPKKTHGFKVIGSIVLFEELKEKMDKRSYEKFKKFIKTKTIGIGGPFWWDVKRYLES